MMMMMMICSISTRIILIYNHLECEYLHDDDDDDMSHLHKSHPFNHLECEHLHDDDDDDMSHLHKSHPYNHLECEHLHPVCNLLPLWKDVRQALGAQHVPDCKYE